VHAASERFASDPNDGLAVQLSYLLGQLVEPR
jgi:hypothetical protein